MKKIEIKKIKSKWLVNGKQYADLCECEKSFFNSFLAMMKRSLTILVLLISSFCFSQKHFVRSENSRHTVTINQDGTALQFDGRTYLIDQKRGWYQNKNDSIIWIYGHDRKKWKDMVKVGFYNNYKNHVISIQSEKLP
jgi:hypothetical protein